MYPQILGTALVARQTANDALRAYARWEYGTSDPTWLLVTPLGARQSRFGRILRRLTRAAALDPPETVKADGQGEVSL